MILIGIIVHPDFGGSAARRNYKVHLSARLSVRRHESDNCIARATVTTYGVATMKNSLMPQDFGRTTRATPAVMLNGEARASTARK